MAAFAAEAYVNGFLLENLSRSDFEGVDKLTTKEKYAIAVRLVSNDETFRRGASPWNEISELFSVRDKLVHPKPALLPDEPSERKAWLYDQYRPTRAAAFILAVADAAATLEALSETDTLDPLLFVINTGANKIREYGRRVEAELPEPGDKAWLTEAKLNEALDMKASKPVRSSE